MPQDAAMGLDQMAKKRGFANRSQCLTLLVRDHLVTQAGECDDTVMMGLVSLVYDHRKRDLQNRLTDLQHKCLKEIISIQLIHLENHQSFQIMLVQGPARTLRSMAEEMGSIKGVRHCRLQLNAEVLPPLHVSGPHPRQFPPSPNPVFS